MKWKCDKLEKCFVVVAAVGVSSMLKENNKNYKKIYVCKLNIEEKQFIT